MDGHRSDGTYSRLQPYPTFRKLRGGVVGGGVVVGGEVGGGGDGVGVGGESPGGIVCEVSDSC